MTMLPELLAANSAYAAAFTKGDLPSPPRCRLAILTCMDSRIMPSKMLGLVEGDAHVIRNAGGRATGDAMRSLILSYKVLGTREFLVVHHTDCGMERINNDDFRQELQESSGAATAHLDFMPIADQLQAIRDDVTTIRNSPYIPRDISISGLLYDVKTGGLEQVV